MCSKHLSGNNINELQQLARWKTEISDEHKLLHDMSISGYSVVYTWILAATNKLLRSHMHVLTRLKMVLEIH